MDEDLVRAVAAKIAALERAEDPMVFVPINCYGKECGPPEVHYSPARRSASRGPPSRSWA